MLATGTTHGNVAAGEYGVELAAFAAAGLSLTVAFIHLWVIPEHFEEW